MTTLAPQFSSTSAPVSPESRVLADAADLIEEKGWCQGKKSGEPSYGHCAFTAIWALYSGGVARVHASDQLSSRVPGGSIPQWNDAPERTAAEVIATLRSVALEVA